MKKKDEGFMSDEAIDATVQLVEAAEILAKNLDMSVSQAVRSMLKGAQAMHVIKNGLFDQKLSTLKSFIKEPQ